MYEYFSPAGADQPAFVRVASPFFDHQTRSLIFFDQSVKEISTLLSASGKGDRHVFISPSRDGLEQIVKHLEQLGRFYRIHLLARFTAGRLMLGNSALVIRSLRDRASILARIGRAMRAGGEILIGTGDGADGQGDNFRRAFEGHAGVPVRLWEGPGASGGRADPAPGGLDESIAFSRRITT